MTQNKKKKNHEYRPLSNNGTTNLDGHEKSDTVMYINM